jgi:hypothetical protein
VSKSKKGIPSPAERPDLYDDYDIRPGKPKVSQSYLDAVRPPGLKKEIAARRKADPKS